MNAPAAARKSLKILSCPFRPGKIWEIVSEMHGSWDMMKRRLHEGVEFFRFLRAHEA